MLCFVHIGTHKTGSTSLQGFLAANRQALLQRGILYPKAPERAQQHGEFAKAIARNSDDASASLAGFVGEIATVPHEALIVSAEFMSSELIVGGRSALLDLVVQQGYQPVVVCYVRNQPQMINAQYVQQVKTGNRSKGFDQFVTLLTRQQYDYERLRSACQIPGGEAVFRPFDAELRHGGIEADFMSIVRQRLDARPTDDPLAGFVALERANVTREGPVFIEAARQIGAQLGSDLRTFPRQERAALLRRVARLCERRVGPEAPFCGLDDATARAIEARYQQTNDGFAQAVWSMSWHEAFGDDVGQAYVRNDLATGDDRRSRAIALAVAKRVAAMAPDILAARRAKADPAVDAP